MASKKSKSIDWNPNKSFTVSRGHTYHYIHLPIEGSTKPTLLMMHGFPEFPAVFEPIAAWLHHDLAYPLLIPHLLGYLPTSQPPEPEQYSVAGMADDLADIVRHERIAEIIALGRDWGSALCSRVPLVAPDLTKGVVLMCVQFMRPAELPTGPADLPRWIADRRRDYGVGYDNYNYFRYWGEPETAARWDAAPRKVWQFLTRRLHLMYEGNELKRWFAVAETEDDAKDGGGGGGGGTGAPGEGEKAFTELWAANGWRGPLNWYGAIAGGWTRRAEEGREWFADAQIGVPTLYVGGGKDPACPPGGMEGQRRNAAQLTAVELPEAGHDLAATDPEGCKAALGSWLAENGF